MLAKSSVHGGIRQFKKWLAGTYTEKLWLSPGRLDRIKRNAKIEHTLNEVINSKCRKVFKKVNKLKPILNIT